MVQFTIVVQSISSSFAFATMTSMATLMFLLIAAIFINQSFGELSAAQSKRARDALYNNGKLHHGDMKLSKRQKAGLKNRVAMPDLTARWPKGVVPYEMADSLSDEVKNMIQEAADQIRERTDGCINFIERTNEDVYLQMHKGDGCWSYVGILQPNQPQELSLGDGCEFVGTIVHEMLHAIGFEHAQNRPDRGEYLRINFDNMLEGQDTQFELVERGLTFETGFDWESIMLYGNYAFSKQPGVLKTMEDKTGEGHILREPYEKSAPHLTDGDIFEIKKFYQCPT